MQLEGKVAIVTGGAGGIGEATIRLLSQEGAHVVISDIREDAAKRVEEDLKREGRKAISVKTDIADYMQVKTLVDKTLSLFGRVDILVNNAAISPKHQGKKHTLWEMSIEEWRHVIDVDLNGYFLCSHEIIPHMISQRWGRVVNISSLAARVGGIVAGSHYTAAKAGILGLTKSLAAEVAEYGITVNAITPGRVQTPITAGVSSEVNAEILKRIPLGRFGTPGDIAGTILFLVSQAANYITGATIDVNGGIVTY
jgi:3-oxoacyl-[acyl-carrier protein] reductase